MQGNSIKWNLELLRGQNDSKVPAVSASINCHELNALENYSRCIYRDDITTKLNIAYSSLFFIFGMAFLFVCWNLIKLSKISARPRQIIVYRAVNAFILISLLARLTYYFNSVVILISDDFLPLQYYMTLNALSILTLNTSMLIGAYSWVSSLLTMNFNNKLKPCIRALIYLLLAFNLMIFIALTSLFFIYNFRDQDYAREYNTNLPSLLLAIPTAIDGLYFSLTCVMLWRYLKSSQEVRRDVFLDRIALIAGFVSFLRVGQNTIEITVDVASNMRQKSIQQDDWIWPVMSVVYMLLTEFFPIIILLFKFGPSSRVLRSFNTESNKEVNTRILSEEDLEREIQDCLDAKATKKMSQSQASSGFVTNGSRSTTIDDKPPTWI